MQIPNLFFFLYSVSYLSFLLFIFCCGSLCGCQALPTERPGLCARGRRRLSVLQLSERQQRHEDLKTKTKKKKNENSVSLSFAKDKNKNQQIYSETCEMQPYQIKTKINSTLLAKVLPQKKKGKKLNRHTVKPVCKGHPM
jgi:hypothetical protein